MSPFGDARLPIAAIPEVRASSFDKWRLVTADVVGLPALLLDDVEALRKAVERALERRDARWLEHRFLPRGISFVGSGADFRLVGHTWPERGALTLDLSSPDPASTARLEACVDALLNAARDARAER